MITFEKIREIERNEKDSKELIELPENIYNTFKKYIRKKEDSTADKHEIETIKNTIKRVLEIREYKLVKAAIYTARSGLPPENMVPQEKEAFDKIVNILKENRKDFFDVELVNNEETETKDKAEENTVVGSNKKKYKVLKDLPEFVGPDMNIYKLNKNDIVSIPEPLNKLLLKKKVIEEN